MRRQNMNRDWIATARTLSEALPYMQRYDGATVGFEEFHAMVGLSDLRQREQGYLDFAKRAVAEDHDQIKQ